MANILSLVWYKVLPAIFGGQKGIVQFSQHLGVHHRLFILCSRNNSATGEESFEVISDLPNSKWQFINPVIEKKIDSLIDSHQVTHLILEHCYHGLHGIKLAKKRNIKLIVHSHNIEYDRFRKLGKWWWRILYLLEKKTHREANLSLFKTEHDQAQAITDFSLDPLKCMIVPFGTERNAEPAINEKEKCRKELERRHGIGTDTRIIVFNGTLDYEPNAIALQHIVLEIIPELERKTTIPFIMLVTGRIVYKKYDYLKKLSHPRYLFAGLVNDIDTYFTGANIFINPVIYGGGVKVKLVEALSFGLPVVSYASGAYGVDKAVTGTMLTTIKDADTESFVDAVIAKWDSKENLPQNFFSMYSWTSIAAKVSERISQL